MLSVSILESMASGLLSEAGLEVVPSRAFCVLSLFRAVFSALVRLVEMILLIAFSTSGFNVSDNLCLLINLVDIFIIVDLALLHIQICSLDSDVSQHLAHWSD